MQLGWEDIAAGNASALVGRIVRLEGWLSGPDLAGRRVVVAEPPCCPGCLPSPAAARVHVAPITPIGSGPVILEGVLHEADGVWILREARAVRCELG
jgi:hypothetical protein